jgi:hypothetical protein
LLTEELEKCEIPAALCQTFCGCRGCGVSQSWIAMTPIYIGPIHLHYRVICLWEKVLSIGPSTGGEGRRSSLLLFVFRKYDIGDSRRRDWAYVLFVYIFNFSTSYEALVSWGLGKTSPNMDT